MSFRIFIVCLLAPVAVLSATLTTVPMQGGMVMPMISYNSGLGKLTVSMPADIPQLTPLLISNPSDQFDPANPWFAALDPSAEGRSFSRRFGFVMDAGSDPLPSNTEIWIRKLTGSEGLSVYRYAASPSPGTWQPIFGTESSTNALYWNTMMFHPAFTAAPGTNELSAEFVAYLADSTTKEEVPNTVTDTMHFQFTNIEDGRPDLDLGVTFAIDWDPAATNYAPEYASSITSTNWILLTNTQVEINGRTTTFMKVEEAQGMFFRMRRLP